MSVAAATFDTYAAAKALREAGFNEGQAEAAVAMVRNAFTEGVATKADVRTAVADLRAEMLKIAIAIVLANTILTVGLTVALVKLLP